MSIRHLKTIGFWKSTLNSNFPSPQPGIWNEAERQRIIRYIDACPVGKVIGEKHKCLLCKEDVGGLERTDGEYIWPSSLVHYIKEHYIQLPAYFIQHVRDKNYEFPRDFPTMFSYTVQYNTSMWGLDDQNESAVA